MYSGKSLPGSRVWIKLYALKCRKNKNCFQQESSNLKKIKAQAEGKASNVVEILDTFFFGEYGIIVFPQEYQTLTKALPELSKTEKIRIFFDVCCAIEECYKAGVAHLDIHPDNIYLDRARKITK